MSAPAVESREIVLAGQRFPYSLRRSVRKTLALRIDQRGLSVGAPVGARLPDIETFIRRHAAWIVDNIQARPAPPALFSVTDGATLPVLGEACALRLGCGNNRVAWHADGALLELLPRLGSDPRTLLLKALQTRALALFRERVEAFCARLGRPPPAVGLTAARTRWGSCSSRSGIRLHWRLIHLPPALIDYVVAHEVAHLVEMNHSTRFWSVVESLYPRHAAARKALRLMGPSLPHL